MEIPQIRIQTQLAKLQIHTEPATLTMEQPKAIQSIEQPKADIKIKTIPSKLSIDQTQAWNDMDLKNVFKRTEEAANLGKQDLFQGIARRIQQGAELMKIENKGNPIKRQAIENGFDEPKQFNIGWIPSAGSVKIHYQKAKVEINVTPRKPIIETTPQKPEVIYNVGDVEITLGQRNELTIDFVN
ncbi:DUF6470 family protein [Aquibacillus kalidii]|uniref:DUF6470 family protein n=1 Tax=Aquibacillus kalidii TaxID=2762597 RepID=UPI0016487AF6|nr:DUF6470 family protein [Aquibacillus kalidii]